MARCLRTLQILTCSILTTTLGGRGYDHPNLQEREQGERERGRKEGRKERGRKEKNWSPEKLGNLPKITQQLGGGRARVWFLELTPEAMV